VRRYVLTERGRFLIALLVIFFFTLLSIILIFWTSARNAQPIVIYNDSNDIRQSSSDPASSEPASDTAPDEMPTSSSGDNNTAAPLDPTLAGLTAFDFNAGVITFLYTPDLQADIDDNTVSVIGTLLASPQNADDSKIAVEIPLLPDDDTAALTAAIIRVFNTYEVSISDIVFFVYQPEPDVNTFEITMSFS